MKIISKEKIKIMDMIKIFNRIQKATFLILFIIFTIASAIGQEVDMSRPAPEGIILFTGMDLANGKKVDRYSIERSYNKKQWDKIGELKTPSTWTDFNISIQKWKKEFSFQELPKSDKLRELWQKCTTSGVIDSMNYWSASTIIRLAAGIAWYDKQVPKTKDTWYKVNSYDSKGKSISEVISKPLKWPFVPAFDSISQVDKNIDKKIFYLKWQSTGSNPAPYFGIKYYDNQILKEARGMQTKYKLGNKTFYIFQDSSINLISDRQYFLIPMDIYGNHGVATGISFVSKVSLKQNYFIYTKAIPVIKGYGITLAWKLNNPATIKGIKIYKSDSFDKKAYELTATVPGTDTIFNDRNIQPDKIYYYYLITDSKYNDFPIQSNTFFDAAYDQLKPVQPAIISSQAIPGGAELAITISDMYIAGIRIYRNDGVSYKLLPISDLIKSLGNTITYKDTSKTLRGAVGYTYAAKAITTSSQESEFSNKVYITPGIKTEPPVPTRLTATEVEKVVKLSWDNMSEQYRTIEGYYIYRRELPTGKFVSLLLKDSISISNFYVDHLAKPGKNYEYAVQSVDYFGGKSNAMSVYSIQVSENIPPVPTDLSIIETDGKAVIQWGEVITKEQLQLNIYRYQRGSTPALLKTLSLKEHQFIDNSVKKGDLYFYFSKFINLDKKESPPSQEVNFRLN
jgi:hypothetical protein